MHVLRPISSATQTQNIFLSHLIGYNLPHALVFYDDERNEQIPSNFFGLIKTNPALL